MSRNENSRFDLTPNITMGRSRFYRPSDVKTTFNCGDIIPFYYSECLPGDTHEITTSKVIRLQTPIVPFMQNLYVDTYYFFVPMRLVWNHTKEFFGENTSSAWYPSVQYTIPQITAPASTGWTEGTIADYFGFPTKVPGYSVSALPFRCYALICDQWFRDQNLTNPLNIPLGDATQTGTNGSSYVNDVANGGKPFIAAKLHDLYTSLLPAPQKGPDVTVPLGASAPVYAKSGVDNTSLSTTNVLFKTNATVSAARNMVLDPDATGHILTAKFDNTSSVGSTLYNMYPSNLMADLGNATAASINSLRLAFQIQKLFEKDALYGSRYTESIRGHFGVTSPDARLQRAEYIGGNRIPLNINQVLSTTQNTGANLGSTGAFSLTVDMHEDCRYSCTEHGYIIGVMVARYDHVYQQGIDPAWLRKDRLDFYWPVLANIGNLARTNAEIYATGTSTDKQVFGYSEAWAEYRTGRSFVTGQMRSNATGSLDAWHLADNYSALPVLGDTWIREDKSNVDRALMVQSSVSDQIFADIHVQNNTTRVMPFFSIPGLIDHH